MYRMMGIIAAVAVLPTAAATAEATSVSEEDESNTSGNELKNQQRSLATTKTKPKKYKNIRIFLLAGDDNVEGFASIGHLHSLVFPITTTSSNSTTTASSTTVHPAQYSHLVNGTEWSVVQPNVFVSYDHYHFGNSDSMTQGPLIVNGGYGSDAATFGPEIQVGMYLGTVYAQDIVVLVKAGWKGRTLGIDFSKTNGFQYQRMIQAVHNTANHLSAVIGTDVYKHRVKHIKPKISGMIWWHGYSDIHSAAAKTTTTPITKYGTHLNTLITNVREDLRVKYLPTVVVQVGGVSSSADSSDLEKQLVAQQQSVCDDLFMVQCVETSSMFRSDLPHPNTNAEVFYGRADVMLEISQVSAATLVTMDYSIGKNNGFSNGHFSWMQSGADVSTQRSQYYMEFVFMKLILSILVVLVILKKIANRCNCCSNSSRMMNTVLSRMFRPNTSSASDGTDRQTEKNERKNRRRQERRSRRKQYRQQLQQDDDDESEEEEVVVVRV